MNSLFFKKKKKTNEKSLSGKREEKVRGWGEAES